MEKKFTIDFFEFAFLVEACIPPRPIARTFFWHKERAPRPIARTFFWYKVINEHYFTVDNEERAILYEWMQKSPAYQDSLEKKNEDCLLFEARFDPTNQYKITTDYHNKIETHYCFKLNERYYKKKDTSINKAYITEVAQSYEICRRPYSLEELLKDYHRQLLNQNKDE